MSRAEKPTVFVIEKDAAVRDSLVALLECEGLMGRAYSSATAFLREVQPQPNSCIVVDVNLPGQSGLDLLDELDERGIVIPAIVTASGNVTDRLSGEVAGLGATLLEKPYAARVLMAKIRGFLNLS